MHRELQQRRVDLIWQISKVIFILTATATCVVFAATLWKVRDAAVGLRNDTDEAHRVLLEAGLTAKEARLASVEQRKYLNQQLPVFIGKVNSNLDRMNAMLVASTRTLNAMTALSVGLENDTADISRAALASANELPPLLGNLNTTVTSINGSAKALQTLLSDPAIPDTVHNVNKVSEHSVAVAAHAAAVSEHVDDTTDDVKDWVHRMTHPKLREKVAKWSLRVVHAVGWVF